MSKLRCSILPNFEKCASYALDVENKIDTSSQASDEGTAAHEAIAFFCQNDTHPDLERIAKKHNVDASTLEFLYNQSIKCFESVASYFETHHIQEMDLDSEKLRGTADLIGGNDNALCVMDWKTGRVRTDYSMQLQGYAYLAAKTYGFPPSGVITTMIGWIRYGEIEIKKYTREDLIDFENWLVSQSAKIGKEYAPGVHCCYCQQKYTCGARSKYLRESIAMFLHDPEWDTREGLALLYTRAKAIRAALDHYDDALKIAAADAPIDLGDGNFYAQKMEDREEIDVEKAWPILQNEIGLNDADMAACVSLTKTALAKIVRSKAPKGNAAAWERETVQALRDGGAINKKTITKFSVQKKDVENV